MVVNWNLNQYVFFNYLFFSGLLNLIKNIRGKKKTLGKQKLGKAVNTCTCTDCRYIIKITITCLEKKFLSGRQVCGWQVPLY